MQAPANWLRASAPTASARGGVVLLHRRGSSPADLARLAEHLATPGVAFLLPRSPDGSCYPRRFLAPRAENEPHFTAALATMEAAVGELLAAGLLSTRIAVAGSSQGACLALAHAYAAARFPPPPQGSGPARTVIIRSGSRWRRRAAFTSGAVSASTRPG